MRAKAKVEGEGEDEGEDEGESEGEGQDESRSQGEGQGRPRLLETGGLVQLDRRARARATWIVNGGDIGDFGGGWLEHPRQWRGAQRPGLYL